MSRLNSSERDMIDRLESMSIEEARKALTEKQFGDIGSPNHRFCSSWLSTKESELRDAREEESLSIAKDALDNSSEANSISRNALQVSRSAKWIATSAIILSIIMAIGQIIEWSLN